MPYLVPPMDYEPPEDFVRFVAVHLPDLQREAARLTGGPQHADEIYPEALSDVACHWRRLRLRRRLTRRDAPSEFLLQRLGTRAKQWRDDQIYEVEVTLLRPPPVHAAAPPTIALRKAAVLPGTARIGVIGTADAGIAWVHAYRRQQWHRAGAGPAAGGGVDRLGARLASGVLAAGRPGRGGLFPGLCRVGAGLPDPPRLSESKPYPARYSTRSSDRSNSR